MEEYRRKRCTECRQTKDTRSFDISPKTERTYPRCKECRRILPRKQKAGRPRLSAMALRDRTKRRCAECLQRFTPRTLYQKVCSPLCEELWESHRVILQQAGHRELRIDGDVILLDCDDFRWARFFEWHIEHGGSREHPIAYVYRPCRFQDKVVHLKMEREIMDTPDGLVTDHINHNGLDNRKGNLRICTQAENVRNKRKSAGKSSQYKGVCWNKQQSRWRAYIAGGERYRYLGNFKNEEDAARAYDKAARDQYGQFACCNFPEEQLVAAS